jgi:hypothetical protein
VEEKRIKLSAFWVSLMLTYLLGDVLRIFSGDFVAGEMGAAAGSQALYLVAAVVLLIPIVMIPLSLILKYRANRWANILGAAGLFLFNAIGLPTYPSLYDQFLIVVGLCFNLLTIWQAWKWREA